MDTSDKKIFATLFFSMFSTITGVGIVVPLLPVYAHDLGASGLYIGLIFGVFSISRTFFLPYFGKRSDEKGRKPYIITGLFAYMVISVAFIYSKNIETLIGIRCIQGIASAMIMPVIQAYIGDIIPKNREGFVMGLFNMSVFLGLSMGPLIGGVLKDYVGLRFSFISMGILAMIGFLLSFFLLPSVQSERSVTRAGGKNIIPWKILLKNKNIIGLSFFRFAYTTCIGIIWGFLPVFADLEFSLSGSSIGILVMMGVFISGIMQTPMGMVADRMNRRIMAVMGGLVVGYAVFSFRWANGFSDLLLASILFGIGGGVGMVPVMAMAVQQGHKSGAMGAVMGLITMSHSMGMMFGSLAAGIMMDMFQLRQAFSFGALIMVAGVILFFICTCPTEIRRGELDIQ